MSRSSVPVVESIRFDSAFAGEGHGRGEARAWPLVLRDVIAALRLRIAEFYGRVPPVEPTDWHPWQVFMPVRCEDGAWTFGHVWRSRRDGRWRYAHREESSSEWQAKIW